MKSGFLLGWEGIGWLQRILMIKITSRVPKFLGKRPGMAFKQPVFVSIVGIEVILTGVDVCGGASG